MKQTALSKDTLPVNRRLGFREVQSAAASFSEERTYS